MSLTVLRPGMLTSIQDLGRCGYQKYGVIASGVMDPLAHRLANLLVGNEEKEATLEMTMLGPVLEFERDTLLSICGGNLCPSIDGVEVPLWRPVFVRRGSHLRFQGCAEGCRAYMAVAGGFDLPLELGSRSTYLRAEIGGYQGRALKKGDRLSFGEPSGLSLRMLKQLSCGQRGAFVTVDWTITSNFVSVSRNNRIRVMRGKEFDLFTEESRKLIMDSHYKVTPQSDRMGYRLEGPKLTLSQPFELISEAVAFGTVQVPPEGKPIILLADRQTTGGYPKIAQIASVDLSVLAQAKPGDEISFWEISHEEAQRLYLLREKEIQQLKHGILLRA